ncbi:MAG: S8 family serine peptidase [Dehalococcoidia bacterium]|nr:S8 family serine peptidase [Dehalococcoidia bacterium]
MRPSLLFLCFVLAGGAGFLIVRAPEIGQAAEPDNPSGRLIVLYAPVTGDAQPPGPAGIPRLAQSEHVAIITPAPGSEEATVAALRRDPRVRHIERDFPIYAQLEPNDNRYPEQWALPKIGAPVAWSIITGTAAITVAVIDSGIDLAHPEFAGRILPGWNFVDKNDSPNDDYGHGTHVAGIIAAAGNNGIGVAGLAWGVPILPLKVLNGSGAGYGSDLILALEYARERGVKIVNISLGTTTNSVALQDAIDRATAAGMLIVASAGNTGANGNTPVYPGASRGVLAVAATDAADRRASFSTRGSAVGVAAPGVGILSTYRGGGYLSLSGTSMASPMVAGLAALIWSRTPSLTADHVRQQIIETALDLGPPGRDDEYGAGRIDAAAWARRISNLHPTPTPTPLPSTPTPVPTATPTPTPASPAPTRPAPPEAPSGSLPRSAFSVFVPLASY